MSNYELLRKYYQLQQSIMFDRLIDLKFALMGYSLIDKSVYWNNALVNRVLTERELKEIEGNFRKLKRETIIYFERSVSNEKLQKILFRRGYRQAYEDSWQFWGGVTVDETHFKSIRKVKTKEDLGVFLKTFDACYQKDDPQNVYGELGDYLKAAEKSWHNHLASDLLEYFVVFKEKEPVAVSTLSSYDGLGYISNVGSLLSVRGKGYGKAATLYCVKTSLRRGNTVHCLATEAGSYPNAFYQRIGFYTGFSAIGLKSDG